MPGPEAGPGAVTLAEDLDPRTGSLRGGPCRRRGLWSPRFLEGPGAGRSSGQGCELAPLSPGSRTGPMPAKGTRAWQDCSPELPGQVGPLAPPHRWESRGPWVVRQAHGQQPLGPLSPPRALGSVPGCGPKAVSATGRAVDEPHQPHTGGDRRLWSGLSPLCPVFLAEGAAGLAADDPPCPCPGQGRWAVRCLGVPSLASGCRGQELSVVEAAGDPQTRLQR